MRTTVRIDDDLYRRLKQRAVETGRTIGSLIEDAVRAALAPKPPSSEELEPLPTCGGSGVMPGVDITSNVAVRDAMDADESLDALR